MDGNKERAMDGERRQSLWDENRVAGKKTRVGLKPKIASDYEEVLRLFAEPLPTKEVLSNTIGQLYLRLRGIHSVHWLVNQFNPSERTCAKKYLEQQRQAAVARGQLPRLPHGVNIYAAVYRLNLPLAAVELAYRRKFLTPEEYGRLCRHLDAIFPEKGLALNLRRAAADFKLVVDEHRRLVIWKGKVVDIDFERRPTLWNYFWTLASAAERGRGITAADFSEGTEADNLRDWKSKVTTSPATAFPRDLAVLIHNSDGRHHLQLERRQIRVFPRASPGAEV